ncbi:flippase [Bacillus sp. AGMB 02131]|uniref:Flippase n=1 Tax=Peribacillus faecalis TaxID=2772559 RepID=A0A927HAJ4_9BACI|nr:flippase [Peribacillus faecalis]MBD3107617.1 flippase [Peribacillus faecalis]
MSIAKNYFYNVAYQIVVLIIPLITIPYISRVLGSSGIGTNAYTNSIVQYFVLFGTIGISLYGNRTIAYVRDDKEELSRNFWGIFILKILTTLTAYGVFLFYLNITDEFKNIFVFQSLYIIAAAVDISWLFMGLEDFKKTVIRNLIVRLMGVILIFVFVKTTSDLWKYVFILSASQLIGHLTLWFYLPKTVIKVKLKWKDISKHFLPSIQLFIPQIAIQVYIVLNKTMLGYFSNMDEVGFFDNSDKIVKVVLAVVTAMGVVMLPRVANTFAKGEMSKVRNYLYQSFDFVSYLAIPMMFGLAGIANEFTPWFFGPGYSKTSILIGVISPAIVFIAWSNVLGQQYLLPVGKVRGYTSSVCVGALVNFSLNLLLIKHFLSIGTAIATVIAECMVTLVQIYWVRRDIELKKLFIPIWKYFLSGAIMFGVIRFLGVIMGIGMFTTIIQCVLGAISYFAILFLLQSDMNKKLFSKGWEIIGKVIQS